MPGQPFQITGSGFTPEESVKLWETAPDSSVTGLVSILADSNGNLNFTYHSNGPLAGDWNITAHGLTVLSGFRIAWQKWPSYRSSKIKIFDFCCAT